MIEIGKVYRFRKSGNLVRVLAPTDYGGAGNFEVERVDTGKGMIVSGSALEPVTGE